MLPWFAAELVAEALHQGASITRYGREWLIGKIELEPGVLAGRIGFRGEDDVVEVWDDDQKDFAPQAVPTGTVAPFVIDLCSLRLAIQPRGRDMALNGVVQAIRHLLSKTTSPWAIEPITERVSLGTWLSGVHHVTRIRFTVKQPNPHWAGAEQLEEVMENARAKLASLELAAPDGIRYGSSFVSQTQHHVERGYGTSRWEGERPDGSKTIYSSEVGVETPVELGVGEDGEVPATAMRNALADPLPVTDNHGHGDEERNRDES
ncbi:MAG: hypothetical protein Q4P36_04890 [Bowdeniella nasicola]|nr:hypothetical protein [Bowdeniella nasicola]